MEGAEEADNNDTNEQQQRQQGAGTGQNTTMLQNLVAGQDGVLVAVIGLFIAAAFSGFVALPDQHVQKGEKHILGVGDILHHNGFLIVMALTVVIVGGSSPTVAIIWPIIKEQPFWLQTNAKIVMIAFLLYYAFASNNKVPKSSFGTESHSIPIYWLLWPCAFAFYGLLYGFLMIVEDGIYGIGSAAILRIYGILCGIGSAVIHRIRSLYDVPINSASSRGPRQSLEA